MKKVFLTSAPTKEPVVTPAFVFAWLVNFAQFMIFYVLVTTMAGYAVKEFAANNASAGLASSAFVIGATGLAYSRDSWWMRWGGGECCSPRWCWSS